ncbi:hypothetical protein DFH09DRAFT_1120480 [Mycena vulgaris]|nr:hypothetical protein DFH09DRAFT_1120480 [Mycena vulgaris]
MILASCAPFGRRCLFADSISPTSTTILKIRLLLEHSPHPRDSVSEVVARTARRWGAFTRHQGLEDSRRPGAQRHSGGNPPREPTTLKRAIWTVRTFTPFSSGVEGGCKDGCALGCSLLHQDREYGNAVVDPRRLLGLQVQLRVRAAPCS